MQILRLHTSILITSDYEGVEDGKPLFIRVPADLVLVMDKISKAFFNRIGESGARKRAIGESGNSDFNGSLNEERLQFAAFLKDIG
jgi:hypothetical protein